jgi:hypothetical protein
MSQQSERRRGSIQSKAITPQEIEIWLARFWQTEGFRRTYQKHQLVGHLFFKIDLRRRASSNASRKAKLGDDHQAAAATVAARSGGSGVKRAV